jgi:Flp pilus assembly protein protease CpaA
MVYVDILIGVYTLLLMWCAALRDAREREIPDMAPAMLMILGIASAFLPDHSYWAIPLPDRVAGFALPTAALYILYRLNKPVGGGDLKLCAALGLLLGLPRFAAVYLVGGVIALVWALVKKEKSVPLAVFLAIGVLVCLIL